MRTYLYLLLSLVWFMILAPERSRAQSGDAARGAEIMRELTARRATVARMGRTLSAAIHSTTVLTVNSDRAKFALVPTQTIAYEAIGSYMNAPDAGTRIRIGAVRKSAAAEGIAGNLLSNIESLGRYFTIDDDEIVFLNTAIPSPLAPDASLHYSFALAGQSTVAGESVYQIDVRPTSTLYPGFSGRLLVHQKTYDLVQLDLSPSEATSIPFITTLRIVQNYSPVAAGHSYRPDSLEVSGSAFVRLVGFGLVETAVDFTMKSTLEQRRTEGIAPDSVRLQLEPLVVVAGADSMDAAFWQANGRLSAAQVESIERSRVAAAARSGPFKFSFVPLIDYNRAGAVTLGAGPSINYGPIGFSGTGGYSFGLERPVGEGTITLSHQFGPHLNGAVRGSAFSQLATTTTGDKSYPRAMNTLVSATLHQDYYNFLRKDGWSAGADIGYEPVRLAVTYEESRQFSVGNNARFSLLTLNGKEFQENPRITDGSYRTMYGELSWGRVVPFLKITPSGSIDVRWSLMGLSGTRTDVDTSFSLAEGLLSVSIPVMSTGYNPITLTVLGAGGRGSATLVPQYQFRLRTSAASFGKPGGFVSPPKGSYGGTEYVALGAELNLTDLPWRAIGLPTYNGRGVELIVAGGSARYQQRHYYGYSGTGDLWYSEAGIALSRIPLYITDLVAGRVDVRKGFGPLGKIGANFTFVVPL